MHLSSSDKTSCWYQPREQLFLYSRRQELQCCWSACVERFTIVLATTHFSLSLVPCSWSSVAVSTMQRQSVRPLVTHWLRTFEAATSVWELVDHDALQTSADLRLRNTHLLPYLLTRTETVRQPRSSKVVWKAYTAPGSWLVHSTIISILVINIFLWNSICITSFLYGLS